MGSGHEAVAHRTRAERDPGVPLDGRPLPDASVLSAGDDFHGGIDRDSVEIYEPPYLFRGPRPEIQSVQRGIRWGSTFTVGTTSPGVSRAVLVAPGATPHANDMNQRYVPLALRPRTDGTGVELTAPADGRVAPPGYYLLFLLNDRGVPSVARFIRLGGDEDAAASAAVSTGNHTAADTGSGTPNTAPPPAPRVDARPGTGRPATARTVLGSFDRRRLGSWRPRAGRVTVVRGGARRTRYAMRLSGDVRGGAMVARRLPRMDRGTYRVELWVKGRLGVGVGRDVSHPGLGRASARRWRRATLLIRVPRATRRAYLRLWVARNTAATVDEVTLVRTR